MASKAVTGHKGFWLCEGQTSRGSSDATESRNAWPKQPLKAPKIAISPAESSDISVHSILANSALRYRPDWRWEMPKARCHGQREKPDRYLSQHGNSGASIRAAGLRWRFPMSCQLVCPAKLL